MDIYWDFDFRYIESKELLENATKWAIKNYKKYYEDPRFTAFRPKRV